MAFSRYKRLLLKMRDETETKAAAARANVQPLGRKAIPAQHPHHQPEMMKKSPKPRIHATRWWFYEAYSWSVATCRTAAPPSLLQSAQTASARPGNAGKHSFRLGLAPEKSHLSSQRRPGCHSRCAIKCVAKPARRRVSPAGRAPRGAIQGVIAELTHAYVQIF